LNLVSLFSGKLCVGVHIVPMSFGISAPLTWQSGKLILHQLTLFDCPLLHL